MAKRRPHTPERKLNEGNKLLTGGSELDEVCRHLQIAESTWNRWQAQYDGMKASDAKRLKELEAENTRLKSCWLSPSSTRRCSRSWRRTTGNFKPRAVAALESNGSRRVSGFPSVGRVGSSINTARPSSSGYPLV
jgi:transposase-like protein